MRGERLDADELALVFGNAAAVRRLVASGTEAGGGRLDAAGVWTSSDHRLTWVALDIGGIECTCTLPATVVLPRARWAEATRATTQKLASELERRLAPLATKMMREGLAGWGGSLDRLEKELVDAILAAETAAIGRGTVGRGGQLSADARPVHWTDEVEGLFDKHKAACAIMHAAVRGGGSTTLDGGQTVTTAQAAAIVRRWRAEFVAARRRALMDHLQRRKETAQGDGRATAAVYKLMKAAFAAEGGGGGGGEKPHTWLQMLDAASGESVFGDSVAAVFAEGVRVSFEHNAADVRFSAAAATA